MSSIFANDLIINLSADQTSPPVKIDNPGIVIEIPESFDHHLTMTPLAFHFPAPLIIRPKWSGFIMIKEQELYQIKKRTNS